MNVLIIGLGSIAQKHISALKEIGNVVIYALRSSENANKIEGVINLFSYTELESTNVEFAIISNPTSEHIKAIKSLLNHKRCPLFIEKPVYYNLELDGVLETIKKENILTYVACNLRFLNCLQYVKDKIETENKRINEVNVYCGSYLPEWRNGDFRKYYSAIPELGGGVHIDLIHEIDYIYWLFKNPIKVNSVLKNNSSLEIASCDYANYCLDYGSFCVSIILNYYRRDYKRTLEVVFEDETYQIDLANNIVKKAEEIVFTTDQKITDTYLVQMEYFVKLVREKKKRSFNSIEEAYNVLKICLNVN